MSVEDLDSIKRAALLKHIGITSVAAITGVVAVEGDAGAQQPYNLGFGGSLGETFEITRTRKNRPPPTLPQAVLVSTVQIVTELSDVNVKPDLTYEVLEIATPYSIGTDEAGAEHGSDYGGTVSPRKISKPLYFVIGYQKPKS